MEKKKYTFKELRTIAIQHGVTFTTGDRGKNEESLETLRKLRKENAEKEEQAEQYIQKGIDLARKLQLKRFNVFLNDDMTGIELILPHHSEDLEKRISEVQPDFKVEVRESKLLSVPETLFASHPRPPHSSSVDLFPSLHDDDPRHLLAIRDEQFLNMGKLPVLVERIGFREE